MTRLAGGAMNSYLDIAADTTKSSTARGRALEDLVAYMFAKIPGVAVVAQNAVDVFECQELDVVLQNDALPNGLIGFEPEILVECKNWADPVGSAEVAWFDTKLRSRGLRHGLLVSLNGITGQAHSLRSAQQIVAAALLENRRIVHVRVGELVSLRSHAQLVTYCRSRMTALLTSRGLD